MMINAKLLGGTLATVLGAATIWGDEEGLITLGDVYDVLVQETDNLKRWHADAFDHRVAIFLESQDRFDELRQEIDAAEGVLRSDHIFTHGRIASFRSRVEDIHVEVLDRLGQQDVRLQNLEDEVVVLKSQVDEVMQAVLQVGDANLRMQIEEHLCLDADDPRHHRIASFQLPASAGGDLEFVRQIVLETYQMHVQAGLQPHPLVPQEVSLGDMAFNNADYPQAFDHFRNAYRLIVY